MCNSRESTPRGQCVSFSLTDVERSYRRTGLHCGSSHTHFCSLVSLNTDHKLHKALHILLRSKECLPPPPPMLLIWEQQYNPLFVFASSLLWIGCNVFLLISCMKYSEVLLLSESAVNLFSTGFHPHRLFSLFCRLTQQAHLSVFWGLSVGAGRWVIKLPTLISSPPSLLLHG